jgi:hypothetical protein
VKADQREALRRDTLGATNDRMVRESAKLDAVTTDRTLILVLELQVQHVPQCRRNCGLDPFDRYGQPPPRAVARHDAVGEKSAERGRSRTTDSRPGGGESDRMGLAEVPVADLRVPQIIRSSAQTTERNGSDP